MTFHSPTETNPPFTTPPTWPYPTSSADWEPDYRLRLLEAAILYLWSATGGVSGGCVAVGNTAPPNNGSTIAPPEGFLWIDTSSTDTAPPYTPPQTPPPTGFNSFTDPSGTPWVSINGSAWKTASNALHASYYRNAAFTAGGTALLNMDTVIQDTYGLYSMATGLFTVPIAGIWRIAFVISGTPSGSGFNYIQTFLQTGASQQLARCGAHAGGGIIVTATSLYSGPLGAGATIGGYLAGSGVPGNAGLSYNSLQIDYLGTG